MESAKNIDKSHVVKHRDASLLLQYVQNCFRQRNFRPEVIVEIGSNTGATTSEISRMFPMAKVIGIEHDNTLCEFSRTFQNTRTNVSYACANIWSSQFWDQFVSQADMKDHSVDLVVSTHYLRMMDSNIETAFDNIDRLLKPDGFLFCTISLWSDLFDIEKKVALQKFPEILTKSQRASQLVTLFKPNRAEERVQLKQMLEKKQFGTSPETVVVYNHIKIKSIKKVQDSIKCMCPLGSCISDSNRLNFYSQFFESVYEEYFVGSRDSVHAFEYEYMFVSCCKLVTK